MFGVFFLFFFMSIAYLLLAPEIAVDINTLPLSGFVAPFHLSNIKISPVQNNQFEANASVV